MKRVLYIATGTRVGGSTISASLIIEHLSYNQNKYYPIIAIPSINGENYKVYKGTGAEIYNYNLSNSDVELLQNKHASPIKRLMIYIKISIKSYKVLREVKPDLVHINDDKSMLIWGMATKLFRKPTIWHIRQLKQSSKILDLLRLYFSTHQILITNAVKARFNKELQLGEVIYNGVDTSKYYPANNKGNQKENLGFDTRKIVIGYIGRLSEEKRPEWFIDAIIHLINKGYSIQGIIIGKDYSEDGFYTRYINKVINDNYLSKGDINYLGFKYDTQEWMRGFDIFCLPSRSEPFGRVVIEALASGVPVVATNAGGVPEILDKKTGILVNNKNDLLEKLELLIMDSNLRKHYNVEGLKLVRDKFNTSKTTESVLKYYDKIIK